MDLVDIFLLIFIGTIFIIGVVIKVRESIEDKKELKKRRGTPIEVYRYTYKVYLNDGSQYSKVANSYVVYSFEKFVDDDVLCWDTLGIDKNIVVTTGNISKTEMLNCECRKIKPIVDFNGYMDKIYTLEEVSEREVK